MLYDAKILVLTKPSTLPPSMLADVKFMSHWPALGPVKAYSVYKSCFIFILNIHVMINWQLSKWDIRWLVSHDCIAGSGVDLIKVTCLFKVLRWRVVGQVIEGSENFQCTSESRFPRELRFWPWLNLYNYHNNNNNNNNNYYYYYYYYLRQCLLFQVSFKQHLIKKQCPVISPDSEVTIHL